MPTAAVPMELVEGVSVAMRSEDSRTHATQYGTPNKFSDPWHENNVRAETVGSVSYLGCCGGRRTYQQAIGHPLVHEGQVTDHFGVVKYSISNLEGDFGLHRHIAVAWTQIPNCPIDLLPVP
jgi:hypothetical protein